MKSFSKESIESLKHYVYALVDPETNEIFYVGKDRVEVGLLKPVSSEISSDSTYDLSCFAIFLTLVPRLLVRRLPL